jgi:hypothetical protein
MFRMEKPRCAHPWLARHCIRTLQLLPSLPTPIAIRWAVHGYGYCSDEEPELAAERFVEARQARERQRAPAVSRGQPHAVARSPRGGSAGW